MKQGHGWIGLLLFLVLVSPAQTVFAARKAKTPATFGEPVAQKIAHQTALQLAAAPLLANDELPPKIAVGLFSINFEASQISTRDFTNDLLNAVLDETRALVVNHDPQFGENMTFQLQKYEDEKTLRYHAAMLGATYYLVGSISEVLWHRTPDKAKKGYVVAVQLKNVRSDQTDLTLQLPFTEAGRLIKEKQSHGRKPRSKK